MKLLLLGKDGQVGWELQRALAPLGELIAVGRQEADLEDLEGLRQCIEQHQPDVIINAAAYTAVDKAEAEPARAQAINAEAVGVLAEAAKRSGAWLIHYSTDYVFDGAKSGFYQVDDATHPLSVYGKTKLAGEEQIHAHNPNHLIFRTSWVYAARGGNFAKTMLRLARERDQLRVVADQVGAPTSAELIADVTALAIYRLTNHQNPAQLSGTYHLVASGETSWHGYAQYVLQLAQAQGIALKVKPEEVQPIATEGYPTPAARPKNSRLDTHTLTTTFGLALPDWRYHVQRLMAELTTQGTL